MKRVRTIKIYTLEEEIGNTITHGVMALLTLFSIPFISVKSYLDGGWLKASCIGIFLITIFLMFLGSTLYHSMAQETNHKSVFRIFDHILIYVAIAGTYTPVALCVIRGWEGWVIFGIQWSMVLVGILYKSLSTMSLPKLSVGIYMIMGWTLVMFFPSWLSKATPSHLWLILAGGICYSIGVIFYASKRKFSHMIWHLFIDIGAIFHFFAIVFFI